MNTLTYHLEPMQLPIGILLLIGLAIDAGALVRLLVSTKNVLNNALVPRRLTRPMNAPQASTAQVWRVLHWTKQPRPLESDETCREYPRPLALRALLHEQHSMLRLQRYVAA